MEVSLLDELANERCAGPRRDPPIDHADVLAGLVGSNMRKFRAPTEQDGIVLTDVERVHEPTGAQIEPPNFPERLQGRRRRAR